MTLNIIPNRIIFFVLSGTIFILSLFMILFGNLNLGIDMTGGTQAEFSFVEYSYDGEQVLTTAQVLADEINTEGNIINSVNTYKVTGEDLFVVETGFNRNIDAQGLEQYKIRFRDTIEVRYEEFGDITLSGYTNIGASFGDYIKSTARLTLFIALIGIVLYIAYTFSGTVSGISSMSFATITLITLFHDVIVSSGLYIFASIFFPQFQIDTFFITALLTILGYSINDTIVIFDRIRSNLRDFGAKGKDLEEIITLSMNESITRSMYTSFTLIFVLVCILFFGPESISGFTLTLLFGTIVGTFSSLCIASPLLYEFHKNTILGEYIKPEELSEEDKMIV